MLLDIAKAFDSVWHDALIHKLRVINTSESITHIIRNYLSNRKVYVTVNGITSSIKDIRAGVPQGSILGPILYNIFTNDILISDKTHLAIYADDTALYASSWSLAQATKYLQNHLDQIVSYHKNWKISINPTKTQAITFTRKITKPTKQIQIHGYQIP